MDTFLGIKSKAQELNARALFLVFSLLYVCSMITGCRVWSDDACGYACGIPQESVTEIALHGVTIATNTRPPPASVDAMYINNGTDLYVQAELSLFFSPHSEYSMESDIPAQDEFARYPYDFTFSIFKNESDDFETIPYSLEYIGIYESEPAYTGQLYSSNLPEELLVDGNYLLQMPGDFNIPLSATHIELWFRKSQDSERELVRRIALDQLYAWKKYIEPLIPNESI